MYYEYLINYSTTIGRGRCSLTRKCKIKSYRDVEDIDKFLRSCDNIAIGLERESLIVNDFKLLRRYMFKEELK